MQHSEKARSAWTAAHHAPSLADRSFAFSVRAVQPQRGDAAIAVAKLTPLYRIDGAFAAVRKFALSVDGSWADALDIEAFVECVAEPDARDPRVLCR